MATNDRARRRRIQPLLDYWIDRLHISNWDISWSLVKPGVLSPTDGGRPIAQITFAAPYHKAFIRFDRTMVDACVDGELERCVLHELLHTVLFPYREVAREYESSPIGQDLLQVDEKVCDDMTILLYHIRYPRASFAPYEPAENEEPQPKGED